MSPWPFGIEKTEWLWRAEHAANTAIRDSVSTVALHICLCARACPPTSALTVITP